MKKGAIPTAVQMNAENNIFLAQLYLLEVSKGKTTRKQFKEKFEAVTAEIQAEVLTETIKEAQEILPEGYNTKAFIRKLVNVLLVKKGHKPQRTDNLPAKSRNLLYDLGINF